MKPKQKKNKIDSKSKNDYADQESENHNPFLLFLRGVVMGLFDLVPGISGGTMALITGIYQKLISEINNVFSFIRNLITLNNKVKTSWREIHKQFLIILLLGIVCGIVISVFVLSYFLNNFFSQTMGIITGIILVASILMIKKYFAESNKEFDKNKNIIIGIIGIFLGIILSISTPISGYEFNYIAIFFLGGITITAMILPGISGALILLLLGGYEFMINSLRNIQDQYLIVGTFILGAIVGLGLFSKGIHNLLKKYYNQTMIFLSCLMLGAITKPIIEILNSSNPILAMPFFIATIIISIIIVRFTK